MMAAPAIELYIELWIDDDEKLHRRYRAHDAVWDPEAQAPSLRQIVAAGPDDKDRMTLEGLLRLLDQNSLKELDAKGTSIDAIGELLFRVLFGQTDAEAQLVLNGVFDKRGMLPWYAPLRVRIHSRDERLVGLPWMATQSRGHILIDPIGLAPPGVAPRGWTFESCGQPGKGPAVRFLTPPRMLVIVPEWDNEKESEKDRSIRLSSREHVLELKGLLNNHCSAWAESTANFCHVSTVAEANAACERFAPDVVYFYGHGAIRGKGVACLKMPKDPSGYIQVRDLFTLVPALQRTPPAMVFLNACNLGRAGWHSAGHLLGATAPLVLANVAPVHGAPARSFASEFLAAVLRGADPVAAANSRASKSGQGAAHRAQSKKFSDFASVVVTAHYGSWVADHQPAVDGGEALRAALDLDREIQRAVFKGRVDDMLLTPSDVRVQMVIAYGLRGNHLEKASKQLSDYYEKARTSSRTPIRKHHLRSRPEAVLDRLALETAVSSQPACAGTRPPKGMAAMLEALAPTKLPGGAHRAVWLDCGLLRFHSPVKQARASLDEFFKFLRDTIANAAKTVHVIGFVAVEADDEANLAELKKYLEAAENRDWPSSTELTLLAGFGAATRADLTRFLKKARCPERILTRVVAALWARTKGRYADLVRMIDRANELGGFAALLDELNEESGDDDPAKES